MSSMSSVLSAAEYLKTHPAARQVFDAIARASSISGWGLAKSLSIQPDDLQMILQDLRTEGLIQADTPELLDAFLYPSALGFRTGSFVS